MTRSYARLFAAWILLPLVTGCSAQPIPTGPSLAVVTPAVVEPPAVVVSLEAEPGSGDGHVKQRSRASGGETVHLGPGERRLWMFDVRAVQAMYTVSVTYSNGREGPNEVISVLVDGTRIGSFQNRDSGDATEGWNMFVTDSAGASTFGTGTHTVTLEVTGGDGCVEIDLVTLRP